jgi:hypothetical protein
MRDELFDHLKHRLAETEVPDPDQGWQLMRAMLDATARPRPIVQLRRWYAAAACLILAGATWAIVHQVRSSTDTRRESSSRTAARGAAPAAALPAPAPILHAADGPSPDLATSGTTAPVGATPLSGAQPGVTVSSGAGSPTGTTSDITTKSGTALPPGTTSRSGTSGTRATGTTTLLATTEATGGDAALTLTQKTTLMPTDPRRERESLKNTLLREHPLVAALRPLAPTAGPLRPARHSRWGLDIGLGANFPGSMRTITVNNQARWEPGLYPVINARYRLTPRLSLKAGVAAPSPVAYTKTLSQKSLNVGDSAVMAYMAPVSTSSTKIGRLLYMDVPVGLQWAVIPHLNLEAGLQYSRLLSQQYDTRSNTVYATNFMVYAPGPAVAQAVKEPTPQVKRSDLRYLLGANFTWHRFSAGLQYQGGLQHSANQVDDQGNTINSHTSIAKMQIMYSLR